MCVCVCVCVCVSVCACACVTVLCNLQKLFELEELTAPVDNSDRERGVLYVLSDVD